MSGGNNDATSYVVGAANCAYCAIGGLIGKGASVIMRDVYGQMGGVPPTGASEADDGAMGFSLLYNFRTNKPVPAKGKESLEFQIAGITDFLLRKGCTVTDLSNGKFWTVDEAVAAVNKLKEGTLFLVLAGEDDGFSGGGISSMAHWTLGQVQSGKGAYYDYQTKVGHGDTRLILARKAKVSAAALSDTSVSDKPMAAWGKELDDDDGRVRIFVVAK